MTWPTLHAVMAATRMEFTPALAAQHCFVRTRGGRWCRVLGAPHADAIHIRGRAWRMPDA